MYIYICICTFIYKRGDQRTSEVQVHNIDPDDYTLANRHRMSYLHQSRSAKEPYN